MGDGRYLQSIAIVLVLVCASSVHGATYTVGGDSACDFSSLQAAINAAQNDTAPEAELWIARNLTYVAIGVNVGDQSIDFIGEFDSCVDRAPSGRTTLSGAGGTADTVIDLVGSSQRHLVHLQNLAITHGDPGAGKFGGGLSIIGNFEVVLENVVFSNNAADRGGAIFLDGSLGGEFSIDRESTLFSNTASLTGGAIHCVNVDDPMQAVLVRGDIYGNAATNGGGVYADNCRYNHGGTNVGDGILLNDASNNGGGIYARNGSLIALTGDTRAPVVLSINTAGGDGGGIYLTGESLFISNRTAMNGNAASGDGGALYLKSGEVRFGALGRCRIDRCSRIEHNGSDSEGGAIYQLGGSLSVYKTWLMANSSPDGSVIKSEGGIAEFANVVVAGNRGATSVMRLKNGDYSIAGASFAGNEDMNATLLMTGGTLVLAGDVFWESTGTSLAFFGGVTAWSID